MNQYIRNQYNFTPYGLSLEAEYTVAETCRVLVDSVVAEATRRGLDIASVRVSVEAVAVERISE